MNKHKLFAALPVLAALCVFSSCASSTPDADAPADAAATTTDSSTSAPPLDDSAKVGATDVADAGAFADLNAPAKDKAEAAPAASGDTYYNSLGGETLRRVAFTLYSNKSFAKKLLEKNPDLKGVTKLTADQKVFFDMDAARPEPRFLTKDLLARYAEPLADRLNSEVSEKGMAKTTTTLNKGETLQDVSQRLYGTHRYWTEIYLVNRDKIKNYDRVPAGITLSVVNHPGAQVAKAEAPAAVAQVEETPAPPPPAKMNAEAKPLPAIAPSAAILPPPPTQETTHEPVAVAPPADPIPDTTPAPAPTVAEKPTPLPVMPPPPPPPAPVAMEKPHSSIPTATARVESTESSNSSLRRILYGALIVLIGGAVYYFTRTPKRPKSDMLDLNTAAGRPTLAPKDTQKSQIG